MQGPIGGRPCAIWLDRFALSHELHGGVCHRVAWPDGRSLLEQSWLQAAVFRVIADELARIRIEQFKARSRQH